jgi:hypothetical protein
MTLKTRLSVDVANVVRIGLVAVDVGQRQRRAAANGESPHLPVDKTFYPGDGLLARIGRIETGPISFPNIERYPWLGRNVG